MSNTTTTSEYTVTARFLHWLVAGLIVVQVILAKLAENTDSQVRELALLANHKSVGITILALATVRIVWRLLHRPPPLPAQMPRWQVTASHISHWSLYLLLFLVPVTGWLMSSASAYSVSWFNLFQLPDFVAPNPDLKDILEETHELLAKILIVIASLHVLAALKHAIVDKDGVFSRMATATMLALFAIIIAAGAWSLATPGRKIESTASHTTASSSAADEDTVAASPDLPAWRIDYEQSYIRFTGDQAGATFDGEWRDWTASMQFSADRPDASRFDVTIRTAAVDTQDDDRDSTLADPEWFDPANYPEAWYRASRFTRNDDGSFVASGQLTIKGNSAPVDLHFSVERDGGQRVLLGTANLLRLELGVGTGEWEDTSWVSNEVTVNVRIEASVD